MSCKGKKMSCRVEKMNCSEKKKKTVVKEGKSSSRGTKSSGGESIAGGKIQDCCSDGARLLVGSGWAGN